MSEVFGSFFIFGSILPLGHRAYLKNTLTGRGNIFHYRERHSENFHFSTCCATPDLTPVFSNSGAKNAHGMAQCLSLTYPDRCGTKFCAGECKKFLGISHIRPNRDQSVVITDQLELCGSSPSWIPGRHLGYLGAWGGHGRPEAGLEA